jgi:hypothetical protein
VGGINQTHLIGRTLPSVFSARIGIQLMDLLYGVKDAFNPPVAFAVDFQDRFQPYTIKHDLRGELQNTPWRKGIEARVKAARAKAASGGAVAR